MSDGYICIQSYNSRVFRFVAFEISIRVTEPGWKKHGESFLGSDKL